MDTLEKYEIGKLKMLSNIDKKRVFGKFNFAKRSFFSFHEYFKFKAHNRVPTATKESVV
jgi:hypothetical protein